MNWKKSICLVILASLIVVAMAGCGQAEESTTTTEQPAPTNEQPAPAVEQPSPADEQTTHPEGWTEETHSNNVDPNYDVVFPQDQVNQIKITITPEDWDAMQANMTELLGARGTGQGGGQPGAPGVRPDRGGIVPGDVPQDGGGQPGDPGIRPDRGGMVPGEIPQDGGVAPRAPGIPGGLDMKSENPMWVPATIEFNGLTWTDVGVRYKGNSSLRSSWGSGTLKLPMKLDFDEFEDEHPEIENQRFYGFKQLSLSNAFNDNTHMRDVISADLLEDAGLVAAETAYYEVIMDYGEGPVNVGLYVAIEVIDDTVIDRFFGGDSGNIYEGDGSGASLAEGTTSQIQTSFLKENNNQEADWSDIEALYDVLHSTTRTSDPEAWRESLESIFDVATFLEWLSISAVIEHWDSYGSMSHNFYLYHDPDTDLLTWISWDHNEVLGVGGGGTRGNTSLGKEDVGQSWPLIRYLLDDPVYHSHYIDYIEETINGVFNPETLEKKCQELAGLIGPYAAKESREAAFESAVQELIDRIYERYQATTTFLATGGK